MDILLLGYGALALSLLQGLLSADHCRVVGLFHRPALLRAAAMTSSTDKRLERLRRRHRITEIRCDDSRSPGFIEALTSLRPHCVLVGNWADRLDEHVLAIPDMVFVNCHPSLLPAHRGPNPYASVLRQGETQTGVTFHRIEPAFDTGPVLLQQPLPVHPYDTGASLRVRCSELAGSMVAQLLQEIAAGRPGISQSQLGTPSYYRRPCEEDGLIDWQRSAQAISDNIRGLNPWFYSYGFIETPLSRRRLLSKSAVLHSRTPDAALPGTILKRERGILWVATATPDQSIELRDVRIEGVNWLHPWLLQPGRRLYSDPG